MKATSPSYYLGQRFTDAQARTFTIAGLHYEGASGIVLEYKTQEGYRLFADADVQSNVLVTVDILDEKDFRVFQKPASKMDELFKNKQLITIT
ncbi:MULTISPECIES: hypothetical protein [Olivibacter]|uniref:Uncharacterized protein n=1 Tax=Olivibacter jilunii TaxID=985016 RepID=A0ABW6AZA4_9SPHI